MGHWSLVIGIRRWAPGTAESTIARVPVIDDEEAVRCIVDGARVVATAASRCDHSLLDTSIWPDDPEEVQ